MELIDTHCHLEQTGYLPDVINRAKANGLVAAITMGMDYQSNLKVLEMAAQYPGFAYPALGMHPWQLTASPANQDTEFIIKHISGVKAIGEIGLDYNKEILQSTPQEVQQTTLRNILSIARKYNKPVSVHSRYAWMDAFTLVKESGVEKAVFHWYTGPSSVLKEIIAQGYFISATPSTEYHAEHRRAIKAVPLQQLMLETDSPVNYGIESKWQAEPADTLRTLRAVARIKEISEEELASITTANARQFFDLP